MSLTLRNILTLVLLSFVPFYIYGRALDVLPPPDSTVIYSNGDTVEVSYGLNTFDFGNLQHVDSAMRKHLVFSEAEKEQFFFNLHESLDPLEPSPMSPSADPNQSMISGPIENSFVGSIPIDAGISSSGGRTYSIPIQMAEGFSLTPSLFLSYNSQGGEGIAGYGWELGGVSKINLINRNQYYHGKNEAADRRSYDAVFALDGIPLVRNTDSSTGSSYPLVTASGHILVCPLTNMDGYVSAFLALYPDGRSATYGHGINTSYLFPSYPLVQMINKDGEKITYHYNVDAANGNDRLTAVRYGYMSNNVPNAEVVLEYVMDDSSLSPVRFYAGCELKHPWRIISIVSKNGADTLSRYALNYEERDRVKVLSDITCCNSEGDILPPITFDYGVNGVEPEGQGSLEKRDYLDFLSQTFPNEGHDIIYKRGKFVANSCSDGLLILPSFPEYDYIKIRRFLNLITLGVEYGSRYSPSQEIIVVPSVGDYNDYGGTILAGEGFQSVEAVDVDGDGIDEIVRINNIGINGPDTILQINIFKCDNTGTPIQVSSFPVPVHGTIKYGKYDSPYRRAYYWGDFLGKGKAQLLAVSYDKNYNSISLCNQTCYAALIDIDSKTKLFDAQLFDFPDTGPKRLLTLDIDNDSQTELCYATALGLEVYRWSSNGFAQENIFSGITSDIATSDACTLFVTDLNGDGYVDIMVSPAKGTGSNTWTRYAFTGTEFRSSSTVICSCEEGDKYMFMDLNQDSLSDLVRVRGTALGSYMNTNGGSFGPYQACVTPLTDSKGIIPANVADYKGMSSFIKVDGHLICQYEFSRLSPNQRLLTGMKDSFGRCFKNRYSYLPLFSLYCVDSSAIINTSQGYYFRMPSVYVLSGESAYKKAGVLTSQYEDRSHVYQSGVFHSLGLGFCGFSRIRTIDYNGARNEISDEVHAPMEHGVVTEVTRRLGTTNAYPFYRISNTYDKHSTTYGKLSPRLTKMLTTDNLTGLQTSTEYNYDQFDFPVSIVTTRTNGIGTLKKETVKRTYAHSVTPQKYLLGSVIKESLIREGDGEDTFSWEERTETTLDNKCRPVSQRKYVGKNGILLKEVGGSDGLDLGSPGAVLPPEISPVDPSLEEQPEITDPPLEPGGPGEPDPNRPPFGPDGEAQPYMDSSLYVFHKASLLVEKLRWEYDFHGNVTKEERAPYESEAYVGKTYTYDSEGRYLLSETDALGHTTQYGAYNKFGKPGIITDWRSHRDTLSYDPWGKLIRRAYADGAIEETQTAWGGSGLYTVSQRRTGTPETISHYDALGREILSGEKRFDGTWLWKKSEYDTLGRLSRVSVPYKGDAPAYWNSYVYDDYGRLVSLTEASGKVSTWAYDGASTTSVREGITSTKTVDANGDVAEVSDGGGTISYALRDDRQPSSVTVHGNVVTSFEYDSLGRRMSIIDPSAGIQRDTVVWSADGTSYSVHTGPNGSVTTRFDCYGRTSSVEREGAHNTSYQYDSDGMLLAEISDNACSRRYSYDAFGRVSSVRDTVPDNKWLLREFAYKAGSQIDSIRFSSQDGYITTETFNYANGHNVGIRLPGNTPVWALVSENAEGRVSEIVTGGISRTYGFTPSGLPTYRKMAGGSLQDFSYQFDPMTGNLLSRSDLVNNTLETFAYDTLGRLVAMGPRSISYDAKGNATNIGGVGYLYYGDDSHPYRVTGYSPATPALEAAFDQRAGYTSFTRPSYISEGGKRADFVYGGDDARVKMPIKRNGWQNLLSRYYIADCYEYDQTSTATRERLYLGGDAYSAPMVLLRENGGSWTLYNIGRDYLGSITHIATADGSLVAEYSYDPWGRQRNPQTQAVYAAGMDPELFLGRGFTGHEHLRDFCLINMNARLYDPVLGRFLSPDPYVQAPDFTQNFNRYSYALNNPLKYTDESGEFLFFGLLNLLAHAVRGDDFYDGNWAKYLFSGTLSGLVSGFLSSSALAVSVFPGLLGIIGRTATFLSSTMTGLNTLATIVGTIGGVIHQDGGEGIFNSIKIMMGNYYLDENKSFFGQVWEGISRHTWEYPQQAVGFFWSNLRNCWADSVDYMGGATFITQENGSGGGVSLGNFINYNYEGTISDYFDTFVVKTPGYMHEYGHYVDSKKFGFMYLPIVGMFSLVSASGSGKSTTSEGYPIWEHNKFWTEKRANRNASMYFSEHYKVDWNNNKYVRQSGGIQSFVDAYPL